MRQERKKNYSAIILAAGSGRRMAADQNKIFLKLGEKAIFEYSLELFLSDPDCQSILLVGKPEEQAYFSSFLSDTVRFVSGGAERQDSVRHALAEVTSDYVMIHDGARPFVTLPLLSLLKAHDNAILAVPVKDTIKQVASDHQINQTVPRDALWAAQTPQFFETTLIKKMHDTAKLEQFLGTDDASLVETYATDAVAIVSGSYENIKITTPEDLIFGEAILTHRIKQESCDKLETR